MKRLITTTRFLVLAMLVLFSVTGEAKEGIEPIVSTEWLAENLDRENLVIIDIRSGDAYAQGHIPNAVNVPLEVPFSAWTTMRNDLLMEVPDEAELFSMIGNCGITKDSLVVIVTEIAEPPAPPYPSANATRAAFTLFYAGIENVAILDGGYNKWVAEGRTVTNVVPAVKPVAYNGKVNEELLVTEEYVKKSLKKAIIIDARDADVYFGVTIEPYAPTAGHIPNARSLPTPWMWNEDGTYKSIDTLKEMAAGVIGKQGKREIIVYCGVGGYASSWWFVLGRVLGYDKVRLYDGSAEEWTRNNEMVKYTWTR